MIDNLALV